MLSNDKFSFFNHEKGEEKLPINTDIFVYVRR